MALITQADLEAEGVHKNAFGSEMDAAAWTSFLNGLIAEASLETAAAVGATLYATASGTVTFSRVKRAEVCFALQRLYGRLENIAMRDRGESEGPRSKAPSERIKSRDRYREEFDSILLRLGLSPVFDGGDTVGGVASSVVTSSHFAADQE